MQYSIRLAASALTAPDRFCIWKPGPNPGDYGPLFYTERANASVIGEYQLRGNRLLIDIEHATNPQRNPTLDPANPPPTAGYIALESVWEPEVPPTVGPDGELLDPGRPAGPALYADPRWSDCGRPAPVPGEVCCGKHQIESGQRCYISPDWDIDTETREPIRLNKVALVAEPATWGINLLASKDAPADTTTEWVNEEILRKKVQGLSTQEYEDQYKTFGPNYPPLSKFRDVYGKTFASLRDAKVRSETSSVLSATGPVGAGVSRPMDQMDTLRAGYSAMKGMAGSEDPKLAKMASEMCAAYESHAGALGLALDGDAPKPEAGSEPPAASEPAAEPAQAAEEPPKPAEMQASGADPNKVDDAGRGGGNGPAVAARTAAAPAIRPAPRTVAPVVATKAPSLAEITQHVKAEMAREQEVGRLRTLVASRLQKEMAGTVATMSLDQLRIAARDLPAPPSATTADGGANVTAGKGGKKEEPMAPIEHVKVDGWFRKLGLGGVSSKRETVTAARKAFEVDPVGGESVVPDIFDHMEKIRQKQRAIRAALVG